MRSMHTFRRFLAFGACALLAVFGRGPALARPAPVVQIDQARFVGVREAGGIASWRGLAYAQPPLADLRWQDPRPLAPRQGTIAAIRFAPACPQDDGNTRWYRNVAQAMGAPPSAVPDIAQMSEDCLYLNVWAPASAVSGRAKGRVRGLPVMVWIHGGSNVNGYSHEPNYLGARLARQGVVVVSLNYRLGLLGFFAHPALGKGASGRQGLMDQRAALQWINMHIARFGGDPARITLFGESAGGTDIAALAAMPQARKLFARAVIQSGYLPRDGVSTRANAAALATGLFGADMSAASLRALPWQELVRLQQEKLSGHFYAPVAAWPMRFNVPLLIGSNSDEFLMYQPGDMAAKETGFAAELASLGPAQAKRAAALLAQVPGDLPGRLDALSSGKAFHCPSAALADTLSAQGQRVFVYRFERVRPGPHGLGAYHGAEIPYVFGTSDAWLARDQTDARLGPITQRYWVNFARTGNPNGPGLPIWPQWQAGTRTLLALGDPIAAKPLPLPELCDALKGAP